MRRGLRLIESELKKRPAPAAPLRFLVELEPWRTVFLRNLRDLFSRPRPPIHLASRPGAFWPDVFVTARLPWGRFGQSAILHTAVVVALWGAARLWPQLTHITAPVAFHSSDVITYQAEEYLPPLNTGKPGSRRRKKGDPAHSRQPIISVPREPDNRRQTIVTPPQLKLNQDVPLPNVVAWSRAQPTIALAAIRSAVPKMPALATPVVAPPPEVSKNQLDPAPSLQQSVVAPAPDLHDPVRRQNIAAPQAAVIEPPPSVQTASTRRLSDINIGHSEVVAPAPQLPMGEQHAMSRMAQATLGNPGTAAVPPPPSIPGTGAGSQAGRMIALSVHPVAPSGPVNVPNGNRRGTFAATANGKANAAGTPDDPAGKEHEASGTGNGRGAGLGSHANGIPSGLFVGASSKSDTHAVASAGSDPRGRDPSLTSLRPGSAARKAATEILPDQETEADRKVFAGRKSYAMTLSVPNLNSGGGSWVMHFSELKEAPKGDLLAPVATHSADPGYPLELMRQNVQGTVTLSAVIQADGRIGEVRVLKSLDDRLDEYARNALLKWQFLPALKNGAPVPLQAVVMIPFKPIRGRSGF